MLGHPLVQMMIVAAAGWVNRDQQSVIDYQSEEIRVLRALIGKRRLRFSDDQRRRLAAKGKRIGRRLLREYATVVRPDTILRWHRELIARKYDSSAERRPGRPRVMEQIRELAVWMAEENERWGYTRIVGELAKIGHAVSRSTVRRALREQGIDPAPERSKRMPWKKFLAAHWGSIAACDFFTVEVWTRVGLVRYSVLFVIDLSTRRVEVAGVAPIPEGLWMEQVARNLVDALGGFLRRKTHLIHDRDPLFTKAFRQILKSGGVESVRLPPKSPNLNELTMPTEQRIRGHDRGDLVEHSAAEQFRRARYRP